jgi:hypothetical protein
LNWLQILCKSIREICIHLKCMVWQKPDISRNPSLYIMHAYLFRCIPFVHPIYCVCIPFVHPTNCACIPFVHQTFLRYFQQKTLAFFLLTFKKKYHILFLIFFFDFINHSIINFSFFLFS